MKEQCAVRTACRDAGMKCLGFKGPL